MRRKPGDLVRLVLTEEERGVLLATGAPEWMHAGACGVIIRPVTFEEDKLTSRWCDWWVLMGGELQAWPNENLELVE